MKPLTKEEKQSLIHLRLEIENKSYNAVSAHGDIELLFRVIDLLNGEKLNLELALSAAGALPIVYEKKEE